MNISEINNIKPGDSIIANNGKTYEVIGRYKSQNGNISIIVKYDQGGVPLKDIIDELPNGWEVEDKYRSLCFWSFPPNEIDKHIPSHDGVICCICNTQNEYAIPNLDNNKYICYSCRQTKPYIFI